MEYLPSSLLIFIFIYKSIYVIYICYNTCLIFGVDSKLYAQQRYHFSIYLLYLVDKLLLVVCLVIGAVNISVCIPSRLTNMCFLYPCAVDLSNLSSFNYISQMVLKVGQHNLICFCYCYSDSIVCKWLTAR